MFSTHTRVAVIGGGCAGISFSKQLLATNKFKPEDITLFEPHDQHHY